MRESNHFFAIANRANEVIAERASSSGTQPIQHEVSQEDWLARSLKSELESSIVRLQRGLAFLASTGATAPFIGLFGTVWGIYHALMSIGASGSASIDQVAGPIGEALIMTALGLAVAIPAVLAYNAISRTNKVLIAELNRFAQAHGARPETLMGLSGLGDLVLTCGSTQSRNYAFGLALGQGASLSQASGAKLAEGAFTAGVLVEMAQAAGIDMPIAQSIDLVLSERITIGEAIESLLLRPSKSEV